MTRPLTIVLVSYHSRADLERCLPSIQRQNIAGIEVVVVDNAPGDGTAAWLASAYPEVRVIANDVNDGYAGGNNLGLRHATGDVVMILNPDTELHPGALHTLLAAVSTHPDALITPTLLGPDGRINACGNVMHPTGITSCRGLGEPRDAYRATHSVPLVSGAAFMARRDVLLALGGFDASYFMYLEDTDLSLRARARGHPILCAADAVVTHWYALAMSPDKLYYLERNRWRLLLTNLERSTLVRLAPALLLTELATWAFALGRGPRYALARLQAALSPWRERRAIAHSRAVAQAARRVPDHVLLADAPRALPLEQLMARQDVARALGHVVTPLYLLALPRFARQPDCM